MQNYQDTDKQAADRPSIIRLHLAPCQTGRPGLQSSRTGSTSRNDSPTSWLRGTRVCLFTNQELGQLFLFVLTRLAVWAIWQTLISWTSCHSRAAAARAWARASTPEASRLQRYNLLPPGNKQPEPLGNRGRRQGRTESQALPARDAQRRRWVSVPGQRPLLYATLLIAANEIALLGERKTKRKRERD